MPQPCAHLEEQSSCDLVAMKDWKEGEGSLSVLPTAWQHKFVGACPLSLCCHPKPYLIQMQSYWYPVGCRGSGEIVHAKSIAQESSQEVSEHKGKQSGMALNSLTITKETTPKSLRPKRGIHGSNRDKSQDEVSNKHIATGRSKQTIKSKDEYQKEASRKRALALMDNKDLELSDHKVNVDKLEQEDEVDELEDNDNMPQSDEHGDVDQEESRDKVHKDGDNDNDNDNDGSCSNDDKYIEDNPDSANKGPTDLDDEIVVNFHADNKGKQQSKVTELDDKVQMELEGAIA
ncbi:hypothetical protein EDC04DRAFT_2598809 [Pisolithus marmoratus]|nr:hypothetical protein EDC04DRAFT_2598809 [Pisolithus marmoratus]